MKGQVERRQVQQPLLAMRCLLQLWLMPLPALVHLVPPRVGLGLGLGLGLRTSMPLPPLL